MTISDEDCSEENYWLEVKKHNPRHIVILWFIIALFTVPTSGFLASKIFGLSAGIGLSVCIALIILIGRFYNMQPHSFISILPICLATGTLLFQSKTLAIQTNTLVTQNEALKANLKQAELNQKQIQLNTRPQLVVNIEPVGWSSINESFFGGKISYSNYGSFPARNIQSTFLLTNDTGKADDFKKWYSDTYGAFPSIAFVPAKSTSEELTIAPGISKNANFACIGVLVSYQGFDSSRKFWHMSKKVYRLDRDENGRVIGLILIDSPQESDDDSNVKHPQLKEPNWKSFTLGKIEKVV